MGNIMPTQATMLIFKRANTAGDSHDPNKSEVDVPLVNDHRVDSPPNPDKPEVDTSAECSSVSTQPLPVNGSHSFT